MTIFSGAISILMNWNAAAAATPARSSDTRYIQSTDQLRNILEDYKQHGVDSVLALRGDPPDGEEEFNAPESGLCHARDLVKLAVSVSGFSIGVAVYPEGHCESPSLEQDIAYTKEKIEAGADFAITQMFFDNMYYYRFLERAIRAHIRVPIIPGIMPNALRS